MWELDYKESWALKNWCFWTVVLEKTLESPLDCKDSQPVHLKGNQSCIFIGKTDAKAEAPILWPPDVKNWLTGKDPDAGKDWRQEEKGTAEDEMVGWHHQLNDHEFEHVLGVTVGQGSLACSSPWSCKELDMTEWIELIWTVSFWSIISRSNVELYMKFATAIQNESSSTVLSMMIEKELLYRYHGVIFSKGRVELNPVRNQNLCRQYGSSETAAPPPCPIVDNPSALPSPTSFPPPVSNTSCLFTRCQPQCTVLLYFSRYCTVRLKVFSLFFVFFNVLLVWKVL